MRLDRLTNKFQLALADAQSLALGHDNQFIEPLHLMSALLNQEGGSVRPLLTSAGVNAGKLRTDIEQAYDMWITGRTVMAKAIIFGMAASAIGIFSYVQLGMAPKIMWAGPNAAIGGLLFGFGIVLAGGCETGWMYRAVEGQVHYW